MNAGAIEAVDYWALEEAIRRHIRLSLGQRPSECDLGEMFHVVGLSVRDIMIDRGLRTHDRYLEADPKRIYYLSLEFLMGRSLENNLQNLGILETCRDAVKAIGFDLSDVLNAEPDAALGNGGLGRLAACFLDSMATLGLPGYGYGINYEFGLFRQEIRDGYQIEQPDAWQRQSSPWLIPRPEESCMVPVYGRIEHRIDRAG